MSPEYSAPEGRGALVQGKTLLTAELRIVVAGSGGEHFDHVDRVVEVGDPAFTSEVMR